MSIASSLTVLIVQASLARAKGTSTVWSTSHLPGLQSNRSAGFKGVVWCIPTVLRESSQQTPMPMTSLLTCKPRLAEPLCKFFCTDPVQSRSCCRAGRSLGDVRQSTRKVNSDQTPKELGEVTCAGPEKLDVCLADLESLLLYLWLQLSKSHMRICGYAPKQLHLHAQQI